MKTYQEFISEAKKCWPGYKKKGTQKLFGKTYNRCVKEEIEELEESSTGERSGRRTRGKLTLARGRGADMSKSERTTAAISKKAGLKGTGKYSTKDLRKKSRDYTTYDSEDEEDDYGSTEQDHFIRTYSSARKAAKGEQLIKKFKPAGRTATGMTKLKTAPSSESVRRVKDLKKNMTKAGADKRGRVHTVDIMHRDSGVGKGDPDRQMERGRNFIAAVKDTPKQLKRAGAKKGETVIGKPTAVMPGEDKKTGEAKRAKLYKKAFGKKSSEKSAKTGLMVGKVDESSEFYNDVKARARRLGASDVEADLIASQSALETGWGKSPSGKNNYFGQKASSKERGSVKGTQEYGGRGMYGTSAKFKDYDSLDSSIKDRINKWSYKTKGAKDVADATRRLQLPGGAEIPGSKERSHGAYATDPDYVSKITSISGRYGSGSTTANSTPTPRAGTKGSLNTPAPTRVLAKLKGQSGELDKTTGKFTKRDWSQPEGDRYKSKGGK
jgi:flagellum-specific peptidoglycan hydrolase FlgJ